MKNIVRLATALLVTASTYGNVVLPSVFSNNMVLQRNAQVKVWGWGIPNEEITVTGSWDNKEYKVKTDSEANWSILMDTPKEGGPYTLKFKGYNEIILQNVMLGEVWLCSGQSNMEWTPNAGLDNAAEEIAQADYPSIRFFTVSKRATPYPQADLDGNWQECSPQTMPHFSAVGYFFARAVQEGLKGVPVGVINSSWGATAAEVWMPADYIAADPVLAEAATKIPQESQWCPVKPGYTYNAMIYPLIGYNIAGVLWYQGESNTGSQVYDKTLGGLIKAWRGAWKSDFPFYYVQIAPFKYEGGDYQGVNVRDAQRRLLSGSQNTGMVVISDVSTNEDIHPQNKKPVGERLASLALSQHYQLDRGIVNGPLFASAVADGKKVTVTFAHADGLYSKDKTPALFEVAGADGVFYPAKAVIKGGTVIVSSGKVKQPKQVRYAWHNAARGTLFNKAGLPASSFTAQIQ